MPALGQTPFGVNPDCLAAADAFRASEKRDREDDSRPASLSGNGLLDTLLRHNNADDSVRATAIKDSTEDCSGKMAATVDHPVRDLYVKEPSHNHIHDLVANRQFSHNPPTQLTFHETTPASATRRTYSSKPAMKFNHNHEECANWLNTFDLNAQKVEDKKLWKTTYLERICDKAWLHEWDTEAGLIAFQGTWAIGYAKTYGVDIANIYGEGVNLRGGLLPDEFNDLDDFAKDDGWNEMASDYGHASQPEPVPRRRAISDSEYNYDEGSTYTEPESSNLGATTGRQLHVLSNSHTQSISWTSKEEKSRVRYQKCTGRLYHMGMHKHPVIPSTFKDWLELKADYAEAKCKYSQNRLRTQQHGMHTKRLEVGCGGDPHKLYQPSESVLSQKLRDIANTNLLSPVLGRQTIWHEAYTDNPICDRPPLKEFKTHGDQFVRNNPSMGRRLPPPRRQVLDQRYAHLAQGPNGIATVGPDVPYEYREIAGEFLYPIFHGLYLAEMIDLIDWQRPRLGMLILRSAAAITLNECNAWTRELLEEIHESD